MINVVFIEVAVLSCFKGSPVFLPYIASSLKFLLIIPDSVSTRLTLGNLRELLGGLFVAD
jgi:hypothetical protein